MRLILIRHAASMGQEPDASLSAAGEAQAHALAAKLEALGVRELFSSPYRRAISTVEPFAKAGGLTVQVIDNLRERKLAEGPVPDFLVHMERSFEDEHYCLEGGESLAATAARGLDALSEIAELAQTSSPAAASHGNLIASILRTIDPQFGFAAWKAMTNPDLFEVTMRESVPAAFGRIEII
jgi:2,3-bisphosphoglycerate-dependent phosphoglycerate mutase